MRDEMDLGSAPSDEPCAPVSRAPGYYARQKVECQRFKALLEKKFPAVPGTCFKVKSNYHDFGAYLSVVCVYNDADEEQVMYALTCEHFLPRTWSDTQGLCLKYYEVTCLDVDKEQESRLLVRAVTAALAEIRAKFILGVAPWDEDRIVLVAKELA